MSVLRSLAVVLLLVIAPLAAQAGPTWVRLEPPAPDLKRALCALIDGDDVWVGYEGGGLILHDEWGQAKRRLTTAQGLPGMTVTALAHRDTDLLIGTSDGLARRDKDGAMKEIGRASCRERV